MYKLNLSENSGFETNKQLDSLKKQISESNFSEVCSFGKEANYIEYEGYKYNLSGIKGNNIFADVVLAGSTKSVTSVELRRSNSSAEVTIAVADQSKTTVGKITVYGEFSSDQDVALAILNEIPKIEEISIQINVKNLPSEKPVEVENKLDRIPTEEELAEFRGILDEQTDGNLIDFNIEGEGSFKTLWVAVNNDSKVEIYHCPTENGGFDTIGELLALQDEVNSGLLMKSAEIEKDSTKNFEYDGKMYNYNTLGESPIANGYTKSALLDINVSRDDTSSTGYKVSASLLGVKDDETYMIVKKADCDQTASLEDQIDALSEATETSTKIFTTDILKDVNFKQAENMELDFTAFEAKLKQVIEAKHWGTTLNEIIAYSADNYKMILLYDIKGAAGSSVKCYEVNLTVENLNTQENIDVAKDSIKTSSFSSSALINFTKSSEDISVETDMEKVEYLAEKGYIEGDNPFAQRCGVENAERTYLNLLSGSNFDSNFATGYGTMLEVFVISKDQNGKTILRFEQFNVEHSDIYSYSQKVQNLLVEGKHRLLNSQIFEIGENLMQKQLVNEFTVEKC